MRPEPVNYVMPLPIEDAPPRRQRPARWGAILAIIPVVLAMIVIIMQGNESRAALPVVSETLPSFSWQGLTLDEETGSPDELYLTYTIHNFSREEKILRFAFGIFVSDATTPSFGSAIQDFPFEGATSETITLRTEIDLPVGVYRVVGWFREVVNGEEHFISDTPYPSPFSITNNP